MKIDIETIINKIILNLENEKIKNLLIFIIIILITFSDYFSFNHDKDKYKIYSNEITKLIVIGIALFLFTKNKMLGIFFTMTYLIFFIISSYSKYQKDILENKIIENYESLSWCKKRKFIIDKKLLKNIIKLINNITSKNVEVDDTTKKLVKDILENLDIEIINCLPANIKDNLLKIRKSI